MTILTNYPGGKNADGVYQRIINLIPPHSTYIETHLGSGAIMRHKRPAPLNIGLDLDPEVIQAHQESDEYKVLSTEATPQHSALSTQYSFLCTDALTYLQSYPFTGSEFIYLDPPYVISSRASQAPIYKFKYTDQDHINLLSTLKSLPCKVMISGYWSRLYADHLHSFNWHTTHFNTRTRGGNATEWLWMNYPPPVALHDYQYIGEDFRERERIKRKKTRWLFNLRSMPTKDRQAILWAIQEANLLPESPAAALATNGDTIRIPSPHSAMAAPIASTGDTPAGMQHLGITLKLTLDHTIADQLNATINNWPQHKTNPTVQTAIEKFVLQLASLAPSGDAAAD